MNFFDKMVNLYKSYDLTNWRNTNSNYILDMDTKLDMPSIPSKGIDYVIHFGQKKHNFFDRMGTWFRIWYSSSKLSWGQLLFFILDTDGLKRDKVKVEKVCPA